jgi:MoaA/NifB/PqqE/SkfB family radical SAM enzyme
MFPNLQIKSACLVVDLTYRCNARCRYCQWGDGKSNERVDPSPEKLCLDPEFLRTAGIERVVFSGGEPLLYPHLYEVIDWYKQLGVPERVLITNGLLANRTRIEKCESVGVSEFVFSIDALEAGPSESARAMSATLHSLILNNLQLASEVSDRTGAKLTINCVLSSINCDLNTITALVEHAASVGVSSVKFQPVFDDGYLGRNAPHLRLARQHASTIRTIGIKAKHWPLETNLGSFFTDLALYLEGHKLPGSACGLLERSYVLQEEGLVICPWIKAPEVNSARALPSAHRSFAKQTPQCETGPHCFCLQPPDHSWFHALS